MYVVPGVAGGVALGFSPSKERWEGVRGMSVSSSLWSRRGDKAERMLQMKRRGKP